MKLSILTVLAVAYSTNALTIPNPFDGFQTNLGINLGQFGKFTSKFGKNNVIETVARFLNEPPESISAETKKTWTEMMMEFPEVVSQLNFNSPPKKALAAKSEFDFHKTDTKLPNHRLRGKSTPESLGIDSVKQYTGYLDVEDEDVDKHFFYWFFESRNDPKNDPIILWLNGGPGCSSLTGLFFELGPSSIGVDLKPVHNPWSWNNNASVIFLDQPVNVGYSYSSGSVSNTVSAGKDVYAFLELFFQQFPEYAKLPFHISGESYAGHFIPVFASEILSHPERSFDLTSVLIGNGLTDPLTQYEYYEPMACGEGGEPSVLEPEQCHRMLNSLPICLSLIDSCYRSESLWTCVPATIYCNDAQFGPYQKSGRNAYDIRTKCDGSVLCYAALDDIRKYLNLPEVMASLGAEVDQYESINFDITNNFLFAGDWMKPYHKAVINLLEQEIPVLIYAGDKDFICNWLGNRAWADKLPWSEQAEFESQPIRNWKVDGKPAGEVKNYKHFTFLRVFGAGHMVPYDQPESALDMVNRWVSGDYKYKS